jgi:hypothetical protein
MARDLRGSLHSEHIKGGWAAGDRVPNILYNTWYY